MKSNYQRSLRFATILIACLLPSLVGAAGPVKAVRIKGRFVGTVGLTPIAGEDTFRLDNVATGIVSHLGRSEAAWVVPEVQLDLVNRQLIVGNTEWTGTITAANGDQIFGMYSFRDDVIEFTLLGDLSFDLDLEITGGTGRFKGATGNATAVGSANIFTGKFSVKLTGEISTVGSSKK